MRSIVAAILILMGWILSAQAECIRSPAAVLAGHPGAHAVYVTRDDGVRCWLLDRTERKVMRNDAGRQLWSAQDALPSRSDHVSRPLPSLMGGADKDQIRRLLDQLRPLETAKEIIVAQLWEVGMRHLIADATRRK